MEANDLEKENTGAEASTDPLFDDAVLHLLDSIDPDAEASAMLRRSAAGPEVRSALDLLGEVSWAVAGPAEVPSTGEQRLFATLGLDQKLQSEVAESKSRVGGAVVDFRAPEAVPGPARQSTLLVWAAAAGFLLTLGMAALSGFFFSELRQQRSAVEQLQQQLAQQQATQAPGQLARRVSQLQAGFEMMAAPGTRSCRLAAKDPNQPQALASILMQPDERRWMLDARNLYKCPEGRAYQVWFLTDEGPVRGGQFQIDDHQTIQLAAGELPVGTEAVMVTLEFPDRVGEAPGGETVLFGDEAQDLL